MKLIDNVPDKTFSRAKNSAYRYLGVRERSRDEMRRFLERKGFSPDVISRVLAHLSDLAYLDDAAFARNWVDSRLRNKPMGVFALRYELRKKGIDDSLIDAALSGLDEISAARAAMDSKYKIWGHLPRPAFEKKAMSFLQRRGFAAAVSRAACKEVPGENER